MVNTYEPICSEDDIKNKLIERNVKATIAEDAY